MLRNQRVFFQVFLRVIFFAVCFFVSHDAMAITVVTLGTLKGTIATSVRNVLSIIQDVATVSGVGLVLSSFFKFHQHKMNPTQIPLSQGVTLLAVGSALLVFPHILGTVAKSAFGGTAGAGTISTIVSS